MPEEREDILDDSPDELFEASPEDADDSEDESDDHEGDSESDPESDDDEDGEDSAIGPATGRLADVRVLIVDDDADVRESIEAAFQSEGAMTQTCMDGQEAVGICLDDPPELVILDMMLPKRSGFLVLEKIKGRENSPIVIMVTANEGRRHQAYAESLGADRYLLKPVPLDRLLDTAVELLGKA